MDERQKVLQDLESLQLADNLSNSQVARLLDCSPATWSLIKKGRYSGNVDRFLHRGAAVLKARAERRDLPTGGFVETSIALGILKICKLAADLGDMALVVTPSGCGKTAALREFARRRGDQAVYVQAGECARTKLALLRTLARELGADLAASASIERAYGAVRAKLAAAFSCGIGAAKIIVVDEAQTLEGSALNLLRNLHDDPECQTIVVLADTWRIQAEFARLGVIAGGYEQLTSRFGAVYSLSLRDPVSLADVRSLAQATVEGMGSEVRLGDDALKVLAQLAQEKGKLRNIVKRLRAVYTIADHAGRRAASIRS
jgi:DNA transposition AAA+ family ATPase